MRLAHLPWCVACSRKDVHVRSTSGEQRYYVWRGETDGLGCHVVGVSYRRSWVSDLTAGQLVAGYDPTV